MWMRTPSAAAPPPAAASAGGGFAPRGALSAASCAASSALGARTRGAEGGPGVSVDEPPARGFARAGASSTISSSTRRASPSGNLAFPASSKDVALPPLSSAVSSKEEGPHPMLPT